MYIHILNINNIGYPYLWRNGKKSSQIRL